MGSYTYQFTSTARKQLKRLDKKTQRRIVGKLDYFCDENPLLFAKRLTDFRLGGYRLRIGDYRVIFDLDKKYEMLILAVGHRREIYK